MHHAAAKELRYQHQPYNHQQSTTVFKGSESSKKKESHDPKKKRERWDKEQTAILIEKSKEFFQEIESSGKTAVWIKIKMYVDQAGPKKSIQQCKDKFRNMKDGYKSAKDHNKKNWCRAYISTPLPRIGRNVDIITLNNVVEIGQTPIRSSVKGKICLMLTLLIL